MFYTYVLQSLKDYEFYTGFTDNLKERFWQHKTGKVTATKHRRSLRLVYYEACLSKQDAQYRERQLKAGFGRGYLRRRLKDFLKDK